MAQIVSIVKPETTTFDLVNNLEYFNYNKEIYLKCINLEGGVENAIDIKNKSLVTMNPTDEVMSYDNVTLTVEN